MATKVKGLLKGLRYISQIFDEQKEPDMQIGYPTDVKHVAHIGWDGPSANNNTPSWMSEFESTPEVSSRSLDTFGEAKLTSEDTKRTGAGIQESLLRQIKSTGNASPANSPRWSLDAPKQSRRQRSTDAVSSDSPSQDSPGSTRHARRNRKLNLGNDSPSQDLPAVPKHSRRRKSKGSSGSGSSKSQRSKDHTSPPDIPFSDMGSGSLSGQEL
ncbi:CRIB domain-containing protein RIC5-like [Juglans microcarpa x Juglans regia]|uniref:CRIB domain-containing protein RIC5-like n=1 Tax=Juglans microcarpa x Juglans regia TaxID=2249226 RepID=UPI001B7DAB9F|nr:CRIB domain-containing protein RIC5-like [Juglans microcarpa x Juglans regia]